MKILLITGSYPPMKCGVGDYTAHLAEALGKQPGTSVGVLTDENAKSATIQKNHEILPIIKGWTISDIPRIINAIRIWHPDIVHVQFPTQGYFGKRLPFFLPLLARLTGTVVVQTWHEYHLVGSIVILVNGYASSGIIVVRPDYREVMSPWYRGLAKNRGIVFIPNAPTIPSVTLSDEERSAIRLKFNQPGKRLVLYFGFAYFPKGIDLLFDIADPNRHYLILACDLDRKDPYQDSILERMQRPDWEHHATTTGYLSTNDLARTLASVDAVVLPFREGGGVWNTSIHGVTAQGTFLLTTSRERHGYDSARNLYFATPDDVDDMRQALEAYAGHRQPPLSPETCWKDIAEEHIRLYRKVSNPSSGVK